MCIDQDGIHSRCTAPTVTMVDGAPVWWKTSCRIHVRDDADIQTSKKHSYCNSFRAKPDCLLFYDVTIQFWFFMEPLRLKWVVTRDRCLESAPALWTQVVESACRCPRFWLSTLIFKTLFEQIIWKSDAILPAVQTNCMRKCDFTHKTLQSIGIVDYKTYCLREEIHWVH